MPITPVFTSLNLEKVDQLHGSTDFDVYETYYFATDLKTLVSSISKEVNSVLRNGYGLLSDEFQVQHAILNREHSIPGLSMCLRFYRPRHFEAFCKIGQENSIFHEKYFALCSDYLCGNLSSTEFINSLKQLEASETTSKGLFAQEFVLFISPQKYNEDLLEDTEHEDNSELYNEIYNKARSEAANQLEEDVHFVDYCMYRPEVDKSFYHTSKNNLAVCISMFKLAPITVDDALETYTFEKPYNISKSDNFYRQFSKLSLLYLASELSCDEFNTKLITLEKDAA